jgi:methyltransferase (TIGR00027 family)
MRPDDVSRTARLVAAARAIATDRGICDDRVARDLAGDEALAHAGSIPPLIDGLAARTRYIDDVARAFASEIERGQVVILGAGLDTRATRLGLGDRVTFFEIDLPGMLAYKAERLGPRPGVVAMAHDLASGPWLPVLSAHPRFDREAPTCVIWEGVTYYLNEEAVHATLTQVASLPRATIVMDYVTRRWVTRAIDRSEMLDQVARWNEPFVFGFDDVSAALARHGLRVVEDVSCEDDLLERYGWQKPAARWYAGRMVRATVTR